MALPIIQAPSTLNPCPTRVPTAVPDWTSPTAFVVVGKDGWMWPGGAWINQGQTLSITYLSGQWSACDFPNECPYTDANGDPGQGGSENASMNYGDNIIRGCYHGALIARIGANYPFCVGASYSSIIQDSGDLLLSINDSVLSDDSGEILVQIVITGPTSIPILINQPTTTKTTGLPTWTKTPTFASESKIKILTPAFVRSGPSTVYGRLTSYKNGTELTVIGRNQDGTWLVVTLPDNHNGWIKTSLINTNLDIMTLPVIQAPSTPTPSPTPVPEQRQTNYPYP
jgi:hypothetical protein